MSLVLAGFCAVNCWVIPKLWAPLLVLRVTRPCPPRGGGRVVRLHPAARQPFGPSAAQGLLLAA
jgi:hypothetical protein